MRLIDHDASHLVYDVEMASLTGKFRASIMVARKLLAEETLRMWSDEEIAFLFFMSSGVPDWWASAVCLGCPCMCLSHVWYVSLFAKTLESTGHAPRLSAHTNGPHRRQTESGVDSSQHAPGIFPYGSR